MVNFLQQESRIDVFYPRMTFQIFMCTVSFTGSHFLWYHVLYIVFTRDSAARTKIYGLTQAKFQPDKCPAKQRELSEKKLSEN